MKLHSLFVFMALALFAASCGKKTDEAPKPQAETTAAPATQQQPAEQHSPGVNELHEGGGLEGKMHDMQNMMVEHLGPADKDYEDRFIDMMIPHHEGAIRLAEDALKKSNRPELKKMAEEIIAAQKKEIATLEEWRKKWYGH